MSRRQLHSIASGPDRASSSLRRRAALPMVVLALSLVAAACSDGSGSDEAAPARSETTVDPEAGLPEDTVLFDNESDGSEDDAAPEGESPTDQAAQPGTPASTPSLVIDRFGVLGRWTGSVWDNTDDLTAADLASSEGATFQTVGFGASGGSVVAGAPGVVCEPIGSIGLPTQPELGFTDGPVIGVSADWNPNPREALRTSANSAVYVEQIAALLQQNGIDPALASVDSIARVDLEGDGVDEAVVTANRQATWPELSVGDFSVVLLRTLVDEEVQTAILASYYHDDASDETFGTRSRPAGFGDFNGDGKLEIIIATEYFEGVGIEVFEYVDDDLGPVLVMDSGCGA